MCVGATCVWHQLWWDDKYCLVSSSFIALLKKRSLLLKACQMALTAAYGDDF